MSRWWQKKTFSEQRGEQKAGKRMFKWTEKEENKRNGVGGGQKCFRGINTEEHNCYEGPPESQQMRKNEGIDKYTSSQLFHVDLSITQHTSASQQTQLAHTHTSYKLTLESGTHNTNNIMCYDFFPLYLSLLALQ